MVQHQRPNCYMLVDFYNPVSVTYMMHSMQSFKCVRDLINIIPIQCVTPDNLTEGIDWGDQRAPTESACLNSQYLLWKRLAQNEMFCIMEHDAYLVPEHVDLFRDHIKRYIQIGNTGSNPLSCFMPGTAMEFYWVNRQVAEIACNYIENDLKPTVGPMSIICSSAMEWINTDLQRRGNQAAKMLYPVERHVWMKDPDMMNTSSIGYRPYNTSDTLPPMPSCVTQLFDTEMGGTVEHKNWDISYETKPDTHPNLHYI